MAPLVCSVCSARLATLSNGMVVMTVHIRGGQKRTIRAVACYVDCEACGYRNLFDARPATLAVGAPA